MNRQRPGGHRGAARDRRSLKVNPSGDTRPSKNDAAQQPTFDDLLAGRDQAERNCDDWWMRTALQAVKAMARTGREFQCYDLTTAYNLPEPDHPNRWGALLTRAARDGLIVAVGAAPSRRPTTAKSLTKLWRGLP
jgi:hypothetical protein